ncbi:MAG: thermonuclease family protein [Planctomycetota bacterium]
MTGCVLLVGMLAYIDHSHWQVLRSCRQKDFVQTQDITKYHCQVFTVVKVIDGDTLDINIPDKRYPTTRVRLLGIDTPETQKDGEAPMYFGPEAAEFTRKLALSRKVKVMIDTISPSRDKYDRLLCYLELPDGRILNEVLIEEGFAYADLRFKHSLFETYRNIQDRACDNRKGLWEDVTPDQLPIWLRRKRPDLTAAYQEQN